MKNNKKIFLIILILAIFSGVFLVVKFLGFSNQKDKNQQDKTAALSENLSKFLGEKGENLVLENGAIKLDSLVFNDQQAHFYNVKIPFGKIVYFFVVKDKFGIYRAAANACQVCYGARKGFHQEGNEIVCDNCGNRYPIEKIATEKGGCNPGPINPDLKVSDNQIVITLPELQQVSNLF